MLFHVIPFARWTIHVITVDPATRTIVTREGGGIIRQWYRQRRMRKLANRHLTVTHD